MTQYLFFNPDPRGVLLEQLGVSDISAMPCLLHWQAAIVPAALSWV